MNHKTFGEISRNLSTKKDNKLNGYLQSDFIIAKKNLGLDPLLLSIKFGNLGNQVRCVLVPVLVGRARLTWIPESRHSGHAC